MGHERCETAEKKATTRELCTRIYRFLLFYSLFDIFLSFLFTFTSGRGTKEEGKNMTVDSQFKTTVDSR